MKCEDYVFLTVATLLLVMMFWTLTRMHRYLTLPSYRQVMVEREVAHRAWPSAALYILFGDW